MELILTLLLILLVSLGTVMIRNKKNRKFPPGPLSLPLVGSLPFMNWRLHQRFRFYKLNEVYGPIVGFYIGRTPIILLGSTTLVRRVFKSRIVSSRFPSDAILDQSRHGKGDGNVRGILFSNGVEWEEQRRFSLRTLHELGKEGMETRMREEVNKFLEFLEEEEGRCSSLQFKLHVSILNTLWSLLVGEKLSLKDERLLNIVQKFDKLIHEGFTTTPLLYSLSPKLYELLNHDVLRYAHSLNEEILGLIREMIQAHSSNHEPEAQRDFIDIYLNKIKEEENPESSFYGSRGFESLESTLLDLFLAGIETTSSSLLWTLYFLVANPSVLQEIYKEMTSVIEEGEVICLEDRSRLPYLSAVIYESMRLSSLVPAGVPHFATSNFEIDDYVIPQGAIVMSNLLFIHHNPSTWDNPSVFNPLRFLSKDKKILVNVQDSIPFVTGKRVCIGQSFAEKQFFLFLAGMLQKYDFKAVSDPFPIADIQTDASGGIIRPPPVFEVIYTRRVVTNM